MHSVLPLKPGVTATELGKNCLEVRAWGKGRGRAGLGMNMGGVGGGGGRGWRGFCDVGDPRRKGEIGEEKQWAGAPLTGGPGG
jgi:hypothetical protein